MEDRYLFKAKRLDNGEWVQGYLSYPICTEKGNKSYFFYAKDSLGCFCRCVVDASTICQCTGLKDKNGKLIWENDIMVARLDESCPDDKTYQKILWNENGFHSKEKGSEDIYPIGSLEQECFEVIGNIFDNPELLESEG